MQTFSFLRRPGVQASTGLGRSALYERIAAGLMPHPVRIGPRAVAWPADEIHAVNAARIRGASDDDIRALVLKLANARQRCGANITIEEQDAA